ncbi:MAG TPA: hypothetical protein VFI25_08790 [Planctomycetota bacterium]|jgi:hypothetical protein|nr:hypothetical protein [Planctomycetota bacterium]
MILPIASKALALALLPLAASSGAERRALERAFEARYGPGWTFEWDGETETASAVFGPGAPLAPPGGLSDEQALALGASLLDANRELLGAGADSFVPVISRRARDLYYLVYRQVHGGLDVVDGRADVRIHVPTGRLVLLGARALRDLKVPASPSISAETAASMLSGLGFVAGRDRVEGTRLVVFPVAGEGRLAWEVDARIEEPLAHPLVYVDAQSGEVLDVRDQIHHDYNGNVSGNGTTGLLPDTVTNPPVLQPIEGVTVTISGVGSATTDALGNFSIPSASIAPQTVTVGLAGPFFDVNNNNATTSWNPADDLTETQTIPGGGSANFVFNAAPAEFTTSQVNGAIFARNVHDYVAGILGPTGIDTAVPVFVNRSATCNAFFTSAGGGSINFYNAGGACPNTAYSTVVYHEYGHFVDFEIGGIALGSLSEGIGDFVGAFLTGQPITGQDFSGPGSFIRTADNNHVWPAPNCSSFEVHCVGNLWSGFTWHARANLIASLGTAPGIALAEDLCFNSLFGNASRWPNAIREVFLQDDTDGNLNDGTPNQSALGKSALRHGFLAGEFSPTVFSHTPLADTTVTTVPYPVSVTVTSKADSGATITGVTLFVSTNDGVSYAPTPLANAGGGLWTGSIPAQTAPKVVKYYFEATNDQAYTRRHPAVPQGGTLASSWPAISAFVFDVGVKSVIFADGFDGGANGWTEALVAGASEDWMQGPPNQLANNDFDPTAAVSAPNVRGTDLSPAGFNGNYPNSTTEDLLSPVFNLSGLTGTRLRYQRWLTVQTNDTARVQVNGTDVYASTTAGGFGENNWSTIDTSIASLADNNPSVQVTYRIEANTSTSTGSVIGGWNLDDFVLYRLEPNPPCPPPLVLGTGTAGTGGFVPTLSTSGGVAQIGNSAFGLAIANARGGAFAVLSLNPVETSVPFAGGTIFVLPGIAFGFSLGGAAGVGGAGSGTLPIPIPYVPGFVGATVSAQAGILDPAANSGVALTPGLRVTLCL